MASGETTSENSNVDIESGRSDAKPTRRIPNDGRRAVYEYVAERGTVPRRRLRRDLFPNDRRALRHHLAVLERRGLVATDGDRVRHGVDIDRLAEPKAVDLPTYEEPLRLRPAVDSDRAEVVDLVRSLAGDGLTPEAETSAHRLAADAALHRRDSERHRVVYVATVSETVCGWARLEASTRSRLRHTATLTGGIGKPHRGAGIGGELLKYVVEWATARGYEKLYQNVSDANRAGIDFLTERGWIVEATLEGRYRHEGSYADEVILSYALDA